MINSTLDKEQELKRWKMVALSLYAVCKDHGDIGVLYNAHLVGDAYPEEMKELEELRNEDTETLVVTLPDQ